MFRQIKTQEKCTHCFFC